MRADGGIDRVGGTSIVEVYRRWPTKDDCIEHLEAVRWGERPICPYCGADRVSHNRDRTRGLTASRWKCQRCMRSFSVTVGTIFHNSHIDLQLWFLLISLMSAKKGLSAMQAARDLEMRRALVVAGEEDRGKPGIGERGEVAMPAHRDEFALHEGELEGNIPGRNESCRNEVFEPAGGIRLILVVIGGHVLPFSAALLPASTWVSACTKHAYPVSTHDYYS